MEIILVIVLILFIIIPLYEVRANIKLTNEMKNRIMLVIITFPIVGTIYYYYIKARIMK